MRRQSASRRPLAASLSIPLLAAALIVPPSGPARAQDVGWFDLFQPNVLAQRLMQSAVMVVRSQIDLQYADMAVDLRIGQVAISDVSAWPLPPWDDSGDCRIDIDRLVLRSAAIDQPDLIRMKVQASGLRVAGVCLPPDARQPLMMLGLGDVNVPHLTLDLIYDVPSAGAEVTMFADVEGAMTATLAADFSYLWIDARNDLETPEPVAFLSHAALTVENRGAWEAMSPQMPPPFRDPSQGGAVVAGMLTQMLADLNAEAAGFAPEADVSLTETQNALVNSLAVAWPRFLEAPDRLVIETGFDRTSDVYLDFIAYEDGPAQVIEDLQPVVSLAPAAARSALPAPLLRDVLNAPEAAASEDRRAVGLALLTGEGAPRDLARGFDLLAPLAMEGDAEAAQALSVALEATAPEDAYVFALVAGASGEFGATARLDRIERHLPFATILRLQEETVGDVEHPVEALQDVAQVRNRALARLSGRGELRSYPIAALWAMIGAAAGDAESADIIGTIDERVRLADPEGRAAWGPLEGQASALAMEAWIEMDLPARYGGE